MMRASLLAVLVMLPMLAGCLSFLDDGDGDVRDVAPVDVEDDPADYTISGVRVHTTEDNADRWESFDGTELDWVVYEPLTRDARDNGDPIEFPVIIFVHPWGFTKETYENLPLKGVGPEDPRVNLYQMAAEAGFIAVGYDQRGWGQSTGTSTVAGPAELQDLETVRRQVVNIFTTNGNVGVTGLSLGGGTSFLAWAQNPAITTAVPVYGWVDLYDAILPGDVPKLEWGAALFATGQAGTQGRLHSDVSQWLGKALTRTDLEDVRQAFAVRSIEDRLPSMQKPLFACMGMQETLFPQTPQALEQAGGFARGYIFTGGHNTLDEGCWTRTLDWFHFFLRGQDTGVDRWPALETVDAVTGTPVVSYSADALQDVTIETGYLHEPFLVQGQSRAVFTIEQRGANNPLQEPSVISDTTGQNNALPSQFRQDPTGVFFAGEPMETSAVILGQPKLDLVLDTDPEDFQVVATLFAVDGNDRSKIISRGAYAFVDGETPDHGGAFTLEMTWTKATLAPGDQLVLKIGANDNSIYTPLPSNYEVRFTGASALHVPYFG